MIKEFYIRLEDGTTREKKKAHEICKALADELGGEFYTKEIIPSVKLGAIYNLAKCPSSKDTSLFQEGIKV